MEDPASAPAGDGPAGHRVRKVRFRRVALLVAGTLALIVVIAGVGGALLLWRYNDAFNKDTLLAPDSRAGGPHASVKGPLNVLLIGSDERTGNPDAGQRSDTIIIAHIPSSMDHVYLTSVPRDLRVKIPPDPSMNFPGDTTKINAAFEYGHGGVGGTQLVSATLTDLVGVQFDGAAVINFGGLKEAVDVLGGVDMCVDTQVVSIHTKKVFQPGCRLMNSTDVLDYLRQRNFPDGDYTRQRHQQQFLKAFLRRAVATGVSNNPVKMDSLLRSVASTMTVDTGEMALPDLVFALRDLRPDNITGIKIPSGVDTIDQTSYVVTRPAADSLFDAIRTDSMARWAKDNQAWVNKI